MKSRHINAIRALADRNGGNITPDEVVEAATPPDSPLHDAFEWDDAKAAIEHRRAQARQLIRKVTVVIETDDVEIKLPAYVRDTERGKSQGYQSIANAKSDENRRQELLVYEFGRAGAALERAKRIAKYFDIDGDVDDLRSRVERLQDVVAGRVQ